MYDKQGNQVSLFDWQVGDIFITTNDVNPATRFGGKWERFAKGKTLVGLDEDDTDFNIVNKTGGEKTHKLTIDEMPSHRHTIVGLIPTIEDNTQTPWMGDWKRVAALTDSKNFNTTFTGSSQSHNNIQPYITVYMWVKTA